MESFSSSVKDYLCRKSFEELGLGEKEKVKWKMCCGLSFLRGVFSFLAKEENGELALSSHREAFLEIIAYLLIRCRGVEAKVRRKGRKTTLFVPLEEGKRLLAETERIWVEGCERCRVLYARASLLSCGTILDPEKGYHAAFRPPKGAPCGEICRVLESFGIEAAIGDEDGCDIVYLKNSNKIEDLLAAIGAEKFALDLMNRRAEKNVRANTNRRQNFDQANMARTVNGAQSVISSIRFLERKGVLETLPEPLQKAARLRLSQPEVSLSELCRYSEEEITKSGLNHRLQKLVAIAGKIQEEKEKQNESKR